VRNKLLLIGKLPTSRNKQKSLNEIKQKCHAILRTGEKLQEVESVHEEVQHGTDLLDQTEG
jgi:hypothetical protein